MMTDIDIYIKLSTLPNDLKKQVSEFVDFLKSKKKTGQKNRVKKAGLAKGLIEMKENFDEPLEDFNEYM
jgi:hypothetical protein